MKKRIFIVPAVFILFIAGLIYFIILPTMKDIEETAAQIESQRTDLDKKYYKSKSAKQSTKSLKAIEGDVEKLDRVFINQNQELAFITALEETANKNNINQNINLDLSSGAKNNKYDKIPLKLTTQGNFINQFNYLRDLEGLNYYLNIKSLDLSAGGGASAYPPSDKIIDYGSGANIKMVILADTYWK
ncbi:MAG: type 4a pilus biogenesis protein PilO [bacterium]|nr:type 4a pilus biogenesis protein PilO [bacterium]